MEDFSVTYLFLPSPSLLSTLLTTVLLEVPLHLCMVICLLPMSFKWTLTDPEVQQNGSYLLENHSRPQSPRSFWLWGRECLKIGDTGWTDRAEKRKWLRHCPAASNVGSSARSFKMIGIIAGKKHLCLKWKNKVGSEKIRVWSSFWQRKIVFRKI